MNESFDILNDRRLTEKEAAEYIRKSPKTLREWRCQGKGPLFIDDGTIGYMLSDLQKWNSEHRVRSTAEARYKRRQQDTARLSTSSGVSAALVVQSSSDGLLPELPLPQPKRRRLYHRITNWEREVLRQARAARESAASD